MKRFIPRTFAGIVALLLPLSGSAAQAGMITWNGSGTDFANPGSWDNGVPDTSNVARFPGEAVSKHATLTAPGSLLGLDFKSAGYTLDGSVLTVGASGIVMAGSGTNTITAGIALGSSQIWDIGTGSTLALGGSFNYGTNTLTKTGAGMLELQSSMSATGSSPNRLVILGGTVQANVANFIGGSSANPANTITIDGGALSLGSGLTFGTRNNTAIGSAGGSISVSGVSSSLTRYSGALSGSGELRVSGGINSVLQLDTGVSTHTGAFIVEAKIVEVQGNQIGDQSAVTINSGATLRTRYAETLGSLSGAGLLTVRGGSAGEVITWTLAATSGTATYSGSIANEAATTKAILALIKTGNGTQIFSGANTYTGETSINGGKLLLANTADSATGTGAVTVNSGGTFGGAGLATSALTVESGGRLQTGLGEVASGTLSLSGNVRFNADSTIILSLGAAGAHATLARTGGLWTFQADQAFEFLDFGVSEGTYTSIITGIDADPGVGNWTIVNAGWSGTFTYSGGNVNLTLVAVPEPDAWALSLVGLIFTSAVAYRRRRSSGDR